MTLEASPPFAEWRPASGPAPDRAGLDEAAAAARDRLAAPALAPRRPLVATGHQAWLWHPGILAKDAAARACAEAFDGTALHLVVDHDPPSELRVAVPLRDGDRLTVEEIELASPRRDVPPGWQPPVDPATIAAALESARARLGARLARPLAPLARAFADPPACATLAEQIGAAVNRLREAEPGAMPLAFLRELLGTRAWADFAGRLLRDAPACAAAYNAAVAAHPDAGLSSLSVGEQRVELPLWALAWGEPRRRVYVAAGERAARFADGTPLAERPDAVLAPRALALSAWMRAWGCDLFVHGRGGGVYDKVTDDWWARWTGGALAPAVVASADLPLSLDAPEAEPDDLARARWWRHHLPFNADRVLPWARPQRAAKRAILRAMARETDRRRRARFYRSLQGINRALAAAATEHIDEAESAVERARAGLANRALLRKRDWCIGLYETRELAALRPARGRATTGEAAPLEADGRALSSE